MVGIICEKSSQAEEFAVALGGSKNAVRGTYKGTPYVITYAHGHLLELATPDRQVPAAKAARYKSWNLAGLPWDINDFEWKYEPIKGSENMLSKIASDVAGCDELICGGDIDPSGEGFGIFVEIVDYINPCCRKFSRMYYVDQAPASLTAAFEGRKPVPDIHMHDEYMMYVLRSRWDFLSMQFTRIATNCGDGEAVLREGRLKSYMIKLVGEQLAKIAAYKKIPSYQNRFRDENGVLYTDPEEPVFPKAADVPRKYVQGPVKVDSCTMKRKGPPLFVNLAILSAMLAPKGLDAGSVLSIYQQLYESKYLSYPRTEDKTVTPEQFNEMLPLVDSIARVVGVDPKILTHRQLRSTHVQPQGAHGANRPGTRVPESLAALDRVFGNGAGLIYEVVARSYLACMAEDYQYEAQVGHVAAYPSFVGTASVPKSPGWKLVFQVGSDGENEDDEDEASKGLGTLASPIVYEMFPPRPATPTQMWLMKQLDRGNVGTGSTRTNTYKEITNQKAKYPLLIDKKGRISMTKYGEMSYRLLPGTHIGSLDLTERVWAQMKLAAKTGGQNIAAFLGDVAQMVREDIVTMTGNGKQMRAAMGIQERQPSTQLPADKVTGVYKGGKEVSFKAEWSGHKFTPQEIQDLLDGKEICFDAVSQRTGKPFPAKGKLANQSFNGRKFFGFKPDFK